MCINKIIIELISKYKDSLLKLIIMSALLTLSNLGEKKIPMCPILAPFVSMEEINSGSLKIVITH